ncbi:hypothetical protein NEOC65_002090 [Neochlamydia sp. AcF65]|nr:hypothetical protein [Neochlamydia sp. AcF65]MBS4170405.1 hypothetical protein [Neochlamydia sp. AcF95]
MGNQGKIFDEMKFRNEGDGIYAFKPQPDRYLGFFFKSKKIIVTNAFVKSCAIAKRLLWRYCGKSGGG